MGLRRRRLISVLEGTERENMVFRLLAVLWSAFVMFGASATLAFADGEMERSWVAAESFSFDALRGGTSGNPVDADAFAAKMRAAEKEHERTISTPGAKAERQGSIDEFADLGRSAAAALITDVFADALDALTVLPSDPLLSSESPPKFIRGSNTSVRIDPPGPEDSQLVVSSLPLRNDDDQIVSGRLKANQDGFAPDTPLANVELPGDGAGSVLLPDVDVEFTFAGANGSTGQLVDAGNAPGKEMVLYPNTYTDTDTAVTYTLQGIETFNFLRSAESPERLSLDYELPDGANLQATADGGAIVLDSEGKSLVTVFPPFAADAQGTDVPMTLSVEGNSIGLDVPHQSKDFAYPIMVDPVQHIRNWWTNGSSNDFQGWTFHQEGTSNYASSLTCPTALASVDPCGGTGAGVYVSAVPGKHYPANSKGYWRWTVPGGSSSSIVSAVLDSWRYRKGNSNAGWAFYNLHRTNGTSTGHNITAGGGGSNLWMYGGNSGWKYLHSGLMTNTANAIPSGASNYRYNRIAAYTANLTDGEAPTLSLGAAPAGWLGPNTPFTVQATAQDPGLGLYTIQANVNNSWPIKWFGWCLGTYPQPCPTGSVTQSMPFSSNDFPTGVNWVPVKASDVVNGSGHETVAMFYNKIDKAPPGFLRNGNLFSQPELDYSFSIYAVDGDSSSLATAQSGVVDIKIYLDGMLADHVPATCSNVQQGIDLGSCTMWYSGALNRSVSGQHVLKVEVTDGVGQKTTNSFTLNLPVDTIDPTATITKPTPTGTSAWLDGSKTIDIGVAATDYDTGVTDLVLKVDDENVATEEQECFYGSCPFNRTLKVPANTLEEGEHNFKVIAKDGAGNRHVSEWSEFVDAKDPEIILLGDEEDTIWLPTASPVEFPANPEDSGSGISEFELYIAGTTTPVAHTDIDCEVTSPGTCLLEPGTPLEIDASAIEVGTHEGSLRAIDGSGRQQDLPVEVGIDDSTPELQVSGDLMAGSPSTVFGPSTTLSFDVEDAGSGLSQIEILVDDDPEPETTIDVESALDDGGTQTCGSGSCNFSYTTEAQLGGGLESGEHEFTFKAYDAAGNSDSVSKTATFDAAGPEISLRGALWEARGTKLTADTSYLLEVEAHDQEASPRSALSTIRYLVDNDQVAIHELDCDKDCEYSDTAPFAYDTDVYGTDVRQIRVEVEDKLGNLTEEHFGVGFSPSDVNAVCTAADATVQPTGTVASAIDVVADLGTKSQAMVDPPIVDSDLSEEIEPVFEEDESDTLTDLGIHAENVASSSALADDGSGTIAIGNQVCITPLETTGDAEAPTVHDGLAIYPNSSEDTDTLVRASMNGTLIVQNFKSSDASNSFSWEVQLAPGQALEQTSSGDIAVVDANLPANSLMEEAARPSDAQVSNAQNDVSVQNDLTRAIFKEASDETGHAVDAAFSVPVVTLPGGSTIKGTLIKSSATTVTATLPANAVSDAAAMTFLAAADVDPKILCAQAYSDDPELYYEGCVLSDGVEGNEFDEGGEDSLTETISKLPNPDRSIMNAAVAMADSSTPSGSIGTPNEYEQKYCGSSYIRAFTCVQFHIDRKKAMELTNHLWNYPESDGTRPNAFQHTFWVALMVNSVGRSGAQDALGFSYLHEKPDIDHDNPKRRKGSRMDYINNTVGYRIGSNVAGSKDSDKKACHRSLKKTANARYIKSTKDPFRWVNRRRWGKPVYFSVFRYKKDQDSLRWPTRKKENKCDRA